MKKTILAMAVPALLAAGTTNASINLHNADGVVVDMNAAAEIQYIKQYNNKDDAYLRIDDGDLIFTTEIEVTERLSAVAGIGFKFEADKEMVGTTVSDELYVGLSSDDFGTLTFGRQLLIADDAGNAKDYELGTEQIDFVVTDGHQVIKWVYDNGMFYAGADVNLDNNVSSTVTGQKVAGARLGARYAGFDGRVYLYDAQNVKSGSFAPSELTQDVTGFNFEGDYVFGAFDFSASFGQIEYKQSNSVLENKNTVDFWQISSGYQANEKVYFAVGFDAIDSTAVGTYQKHKSNSLYANVAYTLHKNAKIYAEIGQASQEIANIDQDPDVGYLFGMEVTF